MTYPIAGNQNFTKVENLAGQLGNLNVTDITVNEVEVAGDVSTGGHLATRVVISVPKHKELVKVTLYTPENDTTWWTAGAGNARALVTDSHNSTNAFQFGANSTLVGASIRTTKPLASAGAATVQVGKTGVLTDLLDIVPFLNLDDIGDQVDVANGFPGNLASNGAVTGSAVTVGDQILIHTLTASLTEGQVAVDVYYFVN